MVIKPRYPIYVPSKNRVDVSYTANFFIRDGVDFRLVVEPQEYDKYVAKFGADRVLQLPKNDQGLIYARLWIREHSIAAGFTRHWQFDDNIHLMRRLHKGKRIPCNANIGMAAVEDFTDRYTNIGISGFNYECFVLNDTPRPYNLNCHVYSAFLFNNTMPYKWRLRWNDDVDMCLQVVTNNLCTVNFNAFMVQKSRTMSVKGGCTTEYTKGSKVRMENAKQLALQWPEYVRIVWKFQRWHFQIKDSWRCFKQPLIRRTDIDWSTIPRVNNYGLHLTKQKEIKSKSLEKFYKENS